MLLLGLLSLSPLMPQSHHTPGPRTGYFRAVHRLIWTKILHPLTGPVRRRTNFGSPYRARNTYIVSLRALYGFRYRNQPVNSPSEDRKWSVRAPYGQIRCPCRIVAKNCLCQFPYVSVRVPQGPCRIWKTLEIPVRGQYDARTGIAWVHVETCELFDQTSRVQPYGPVAWCNHENSISVKFLRVLHSAFQWRNRMGAKNRMGPVLGCDWGISFPLIPGLEITKISYLPDFQIQFDRYMARIAIHDKHINQIKDFYEK